MSLPRSHYNRPTIVDVNINFVHEIQYAFGSHLKKRVLKRHLCNFFGWN